MTVQTLSSTFTGVFPSERAIKSRALLAFDPTLTDAWVEGWHRKFAAPVHREEAHPLGIFEERDVVIAGFEHLVFRDRVLDTDSRVLLGEVHRQVLKDDLLARVDALPLRTIDEPCLVYQTHGANVYGHFLLDMLPRIAMARMGGLDVRRMKLLTRSDLVPWHARILADVWGIQEEQFVRFDAGRERVALRRAFIPTFIRGDFGFHPQARRVYDAVLPQVAPGGPTNVFIDRSSWKTTHSFDRTLVNERELVALIARRLSLAHVEPSRLSFTEQVRLFRSGGLVAGSYSSALHNMVFGQAPAACLSLGHINLVQSSICALRDAEVAYLSMPTTGEFSVDLPSFSRFFETFAEAAVARGFRF